MATVLEVWKRRKWLAILLFAAPFSATVSLVAFLPNIYRATATILVERQQVPEEFVRPTVPSGLDIRLQTISQEILSRSRLEDLIKRFDLYPDLRRRILPEEILERMRRDIELDLKEVGPRMRGVATVAFTISYQGRDPVTVAEVSNTLASYYVGEYAKVRERQATGTAEFLRRQLQDVKQRLDEQERQVSDFKKRNIGELPQQLEANLAMLERLNTQLRLNGDNQTRVITRREALARQLADAISFESAGGLVGGPPGGFSGGPASGLIAGPDAAAMRLAALKQELTELQTRFSEKYPDVIRVKAEIAALERQLAETRTAVKPKEDPKLKENDAITPLSRLTLQLQQALTDVQGEIRVLKEEEKNLRSSIATYQARVENTPRREQEFQEVSRDYETTRELYRTLLRRYEEAQLAESLEQRQKGEQFRILEPAVPPRVPSAPKRLKLVFLGLLVALSLAAGAVSLVEQLDMSFHTVDDLRVFTKVPVLVSIPEIVTKADARRRRLQFGFGSVAAVLALALIAGSSYLIAKGNVPLLGQLAHPWLLREQ